MITKYFEICCDTCGQGEHTTGGKISAIKYFKSIGHIFIGGKNYCGQKCVPEKSPRTKNGLRPRTT